MSLISWKGWNAQRMVLQMSWKRDSLQRFQKGLQLFDEHLPLILHGLSLDPFLQSLIGQSADLKHIHRAAEQFFQVLFHHGGHKQIRGICVEKNVHIAFGGDRTSGI